MTPAENKELGLKEFAQGRTTVASTPNLITLETTSRCNLKCVMCSHAVGGVDRPKHLDETLTAKLSVFLGQASAVQLHGIGEPTNSPAFWTCLADLPQPSVCESSINTNFTVINERQMDQLVASNLKIINVSLDAATSITYQRIRGFDFERVLSNIRLFNQKKQANSQKFPLLYLNMTLMRSNIEELVMFVQLTKELNADMACAWHLNRWPEEEMARFVVKRDEWLFDYSREGLWNYPELSNEWIQKALAEAEKLGIALWLPSATRVYFENEPPELMGPSNG